MEYGSSMSVKAFFLKFFKYLKWCKQGGYTQIILSQILYPEILKGKKILITGGSEGIGLAMAKKFIAAGADVMITGRKVDKLQIATAAIASDHLHTMLWDITDIQNIDRYLNQVKSELGGINILINNAAFLTYYSPTEEFLDKTMQTNIKAVYLLCLKTAEMMHRENGISGGKIINMSSINAYQANIHPYFMSKRAMNAITEGFAKKYAPFNIIVNGIAPGYCDSSINKINAEKNAYLEGPANYRITTPSEIAELAIFLCSDASNGIIGQTIVCDGGSLL